MKEVCYSLTGLGCAHCAAKMEAAIKKLEGVEDASVNFMSLKLTVDFCEGADEAKIMKAAQKAAKKVERDCVIYL